MEGIFGDLSANITENPFYCLIAPLRSEQENGYNPESRLWCRGTGLVSQCGEGSGRFVLWIKRPDPRGLSVLQYQTDAVGAKNQPCNTILANGVVEWIQC